MPSCELHGLKS